MEKMLLVSLAIIILPSCFIYSLNLFEMHLKSKQLSKVERPLFLFGFHSMSHIEKTFCLELKLKILSG